MNYSDCQIIVDALAPLLTGTPYAIDYGLDGEVYFEQDGEYIDFDDLPLEMQVKIEQATDELNIEY